MKKNQRTTRRTPSKPIPRARNRTPTMEDIYPVAYIVAKNIVLLSNYYGTTREEMIRAMGCGSDWVIRSRRDQPYKYTLMELIGLAKLWGITVGQLVEPMQIGGAL